MPDKNKFKNNFALKQFIKISGQNLVLPLYHTLSANEPINFIDPIYTPRSIEKFCDDLDFFLANFKPVTLKEIISKIKSKSYFEEPSFHITFDDGLSAFYKTARPILKEKNIGATIFLNNEFIDNKDLFYRYKVALICTELSRDKTKLSAIENKSFNSLKSSIDYLKNLKFDDSKEIDAIGKKLEIDFKAFLKIEKPYVSFIEIEEMIAEGFTFGGHSFSHPNFESLSLEEQILNVVESTNDIQKKFNLDYAAFAFPFTDHGVSSKLFEAVDGKIDVSFGTAGLKKRDYGFHLQRLPMEKSALSAESLIQSEYLYYFLKMPFGKNKIQRK